MKMNLFGYLVIIAVLACVFSWVGLAFFGVALISAALIGAMIGLFIPAIMVIVGLLVLAGIIPAPGNLRFIVGIGCLVLAYIIATLPGGGM